MDFQRIFWGDVPFIFTVEIVLRTVVMYVYTLALVRFLGKRGLGQLSPFEFVIIVALGSAVGDPMFYANVPLLHGLVVVTVVVALERTLVVLTERNRRFEAMIESRPVLIVADGQVLEEALDKENLSVDELFMALRQTGVEDLGQVKRAYLEPSGHFSVFRGESVPPTRSILPA